MFEDNMSPHDAINQQTVIVGIGEALFDCFGDRVVLGGAPANFAVHAHQLTARHGARGVVVSRVGEEELGNQLIEQLGDRGLDTGNIQRDAQFPTGRVSVSLSDGGQPEYEIAENAAWDRLEWGPALEQLAAKCTAVCFGTLAQRCETTRATVHQFLAASGDAVRLLDVNLRQHFYSKQVVDSSMQAATAVKLSDDELATIGPLLGFPGGNATADDTAKSLCEHYDLELLALTRGARGTVIYANGQRFEGRPSQFARQPNADSVGAGDACCAGVLYGMLAGWPPEQTLALANRLGAYVASQAGATPTLLDDLLP
jgi:fructokinase